MCEESTKDGFGAIYSLSLHMGSTCVLLWIHADAYVSPSPSCTMQCGQKAKVWGSALADCNPDCFSLNSLVSLGRQACQAYAIRSQRTAIPARYVPSSPFHLFSKHPNISSKVLRATDRSETSAVSEATNPHKILQGRSPFFALCLHSVYYNGICFMAGLAPFLKNTNSTLL